MQRKNVERCRQEWPNEEIKFYAPGTDSGTFDYFTEEINGESGAIRSDFTGSEDDNVLVQGIAGEKTHWASWDLPTMKKIRTS